MQSAVVSNISAKQTPHAPQAARFLEGALLYAFIIHGVAMLAMALALLPGMPGGPHADVAARMAYVAAHPWLWRLGWLPWQLTALGDVLLALALIRTPWIPRLPALLTFGVTILSIIPDQVGQFRWITEGVALAQAGDAARYAAFETQVFGWIALWATLGYTLGAVGWSICFARAGVWRPWLTWYSVALWSLFGAISLAPFFASQAQFPALLLAAGNALGFVLLLVWLAVVTELVLRRARPDAPHGRMARWIPPAQSLVWRAGAAIANSRLARALCALLPVPAMRSAITDVIYVNYLVPAERLASLVPDGLELQRIGPDGGFAMFSFLTYKHGHFGPALLGPLRRLMPSPAQTNWRIYVRDPQTGLAGVYFVSTAITNPIHALGARLLAEGMPMHLLRAGTVRRGGEALALTLDAGAGSAPQAAATLRSAPEAAEAGPWQACFATYRAMLAYCVPQDRALSFQPWYGRLTEQEIILGIPLDACEPLAGEVDSPTAQALLGDAAPFCFRVARVDFRFRRETHRWITS